jgi:hypothetical protein
MIELIRVPSRQYAEAQGRIDDPDWIVYLDSLGKYDYTTPDGRWRIEQYGGCGGGWSVIDTTGKYLCGSCPRSDGHATTVRTLSAARAFISEWAVT